MPIMAKCTGSMCTAFDSGSRIGAQMMIACSIAGMRIRDAIKDTGIMLIPMLMVLALVIIWPKVSLFLPNLISPEFLR